MRYWPHFWWQRLILYVEYTKRSLDVNLQSRQWQSTIQHIHENDNFWCCCSCCCCLVTNFIYELNAIAPTWLPKSHSLTAIKATKCWIYSLHPHTVWSSFFSLIFSREWNFQHFMKCSLLFLFLNSSWCWFALIFAVESFFNSSQLFNTFGLQKKK